MSGAVDLIRLVETWDETLYHTKQSSRNRVHIYGPKGPMAPGAPTATDAPRVRLVG